MTQFRVPRLTDSALSVTSSLKNPSLGVPQRHHVSRTGKVFGSTTLVRELQCSRRTIRSTDSRRDAVLGTGIYRHSVRRLVTLLVVRHHHWDLECV